MEKTAQWDQVSHYTEVLKEDLSNAPHNLVIHDHYSFVTLVKVVSFKLVYRKLPSSIILETAENRCVFIIINQCLG